MARALRPFIEKPKEGTVPTVKNRPEEPEMFTRSER